MAKAVRGRELDLLEPENADSEHRDNDIRKKRSNHCTLCTIVFALIFIEGSELGVQRITGGFTLLSPRLVSCGTVELKNPNEKD